MYIIIFYNIHILTYIYVINIDEKYIYDTVGLFQLVGLNAQLNCRYIHRRSNGHFHPMAIVVGQWRMLSHNDIMSHTPIIHLKKADNSCERWLVASSHWFCLNWNLLFWLTHGQTPRIGMGSSHFLSEKRTRTPSEKRRSKAWVFIFTSSFVNQNASYASLELFPFS